MTQTPKEKAEELVENHLSFNKMYFSRKKNDEDDYIAQQVYNHSKKCAIITVDEILSLSKIVSLRRDEVYMELEYWIEVKQEIENYDGKNI